MPASRPTGQWLQTHLLMGLTTPGKEWTTCNLYYKPESSIDLSAFDPNLAAGDFYTSLTTAIAPVLGTDAQVLACHLQVSDGTTTIGSTKYQTTIGTGGGPSLPEAEALVVAMISLAPGSHAVGHLRMSGLSEHLVDGNYLTTGGSTAANAWVGNVSNTVSSNGVDFDPAILHKSTRTLYNVINMNALGLIGSQRRRKPRL